MNKIFGIGLSKTGTTSLTCALRMLGYRAKHFPFTTVRYDGAGQRAICFEKIDRYGALTDTPIPAIYKELDERYPGSKFILTVRDMETWLRSCRRHHVWPGRFVSDRAIGHRAQMKSILSLHLDLYGAVWFDEHAFRQAHEQHMMDVRAYFQDRPEDLLIMDFGRGDGWEVLCPFLGRPLPEEPFPKRNVGGRNVLKRVTREIFWKVMRVTDPRGVDPSRYAPKRAHEADGGGKAVSRSCVESSGS